MKTLILLISALAALAILSGCRQELTMLAPAADSLTGYYIKDIVLHKGTKEDHEIFSKIKPSIKNAFEQSLRGKEPAEAIFFAKGYAISTPHFWTDNKGHAQTMTTVRPNFAVKVVIRDSRTRNIVAEQWFSVGSDNRAASVDAWLADRIRSWLGPARLQRTPGRRSS